MCASKGSVVGYSHRVIGKLFSKVSPVYCQQSPSINRSNLRRKGHHVGSHCKHKTRSLNLLVFMTYLYLIGSTVRTSKHPCDCFVRVINGDYVHSLDPCVHVEVIVWRHLWAKYKQRHIDAKIICIKSVRYSRKLKHDWSLKRWWGWIWRHWLCSGKRAWYSYLMGLHNRIIIDFDRKSIWRSSTTLVKCFCLACQWRGLWFLSNTLSCFSICEFNRNDNIFRDPFWKISPCECDILIS